MQSLPDRYFFHDRSWHMPASVSRFSGCDPTDTPAFNESSIAEQT
jgi:hypothetical protein